MPITTSTDIGVDTTSSDIQLNIVHVTLPGTGDYLTNTTYYNETLSTEPPYTINPIKATIVIIICLSFTLGTLFGNTLVCLAVGLVKKLRTPSNLLIVSLAVSDFLVGLLVMPFAIMMEVTNGYWLFSGTLCDAWTSLDVLLCTASILNLCAISIDRFFVIKSPFDYAMKRTPKRMFIMIACVWALSALISIPPLFGWKADHEVGQCGYSQELGYQIYATLGAFYLPLLVMIFVYYKIYRVSQDQIRKEALSKPSGDHIKSNSAYSMTPLRKNSEEEHQHLPHNGSAKRSDASRSSSELLHKINTNPIENGATKRERFSFFKKVKLKGKESKATKTLGVIMGAFTACWLPFFILALIKPFCNDPNTCIPQWLNSTLLWLGYANSFLNPIIYARFNRDFRTPFKEIIMCRCRAINRRLRRDAYADQYGSGMVTGVHRRDSLRPPRSSVVRYDSQGQTIVKIGNGDCVNNNGSNL